MTKFSFDEVDQRQGILCILQTFLHSDTRRCWMILRRCMTVCVEVWWLHRCCPLTKNDRKPTHLMAQTPWVCEPCDCLVQYFIRPLGRSESQSKSLVQHPHFWSRRIYNLLLCLWAWQFTSEICPHRVSISEASFTQLYEELVATRLKDQDRPRGQIGTFTYWIGNTGGIDG